MTGTADVKICEMAPRDGLQYMGGADAAERGHIVSLESRLHLIERMISAGVRHMEVGAFVSRGGTPQMALTDDLGRALDPGVVPGLELAALVPNEAGYRRFAETRLNVVAVFPTASEAHARRNFGGRSVNDVLAMAGEVSRLALADGYALRGHVSAAFQDISVATDRSDVGEVVRVCQVVLEDFGCEYLTLADTNGTTNPSRIGEVLDAIGRALGGLDRIGVHLHDRYGTGIANAYAAWLKGVRIFDSSLGGVGGSAAARALADGKSRQMVGNIATESLVAMFDGLGQSTGIDAERLMTGAGPVLNTICQDAGEYSPPSQFLREWLGYGARWETTS